MPVYLLPDGPFFPPVEEAEPDGLIAIGGDLSVERLLQAYASGIFPWFEESEEFFWFSPDPRMVLVPGVYKPSQSLRRIIRSGRFTVRFDTAFGDVMRKCSEADRPGQEGTWISEAFIRGYTALHDAGFAHSVETYLDGNLCGGLYGVSIGSAFFGESMFHTVSNASKVAFHSLVEQCSGFGFDFIDCQVESDHLVSLGARPVSRAQYLEMVGSAIKKGTRKGPWTKKSS